MIDKDFEMRTVISIAGFDPSGGAGVLADIKTFAALGCYGVAAVTSLTFQNTVAVYGVAHQTAEVLRSQIEPLVSDFEIGAVKIGMIPTRELIETVAGMIEEYSLPNVVIDPVIRSSSGRDLIDGTAVNFLIERLFPLSDVITPNLPEAERLTGLVINDIDGMKRAAAEIHAMRPASTARPAARRAALVKGGHLEGPPGPKASIEDAPEATDALFDGREFRVYRSPRIATRNTHGTGCALSSAIAALLARGCEIPEAVGRAKQYLIGAMRDAPEVGRGAGPLNHFFGLSLDAIDQGDVDRHLL